MNELNTTLERTFKVESQSCVDFKGRNIDDTNGALTKVMQQIFIECVLNGNGDFRNLSCTNVLYYYTIKQFLNEKNIKQLPVAVLNILDAETQGFKVKDEPPRNRLKEFELFLKFVPFVENNEGLTLLTIPKGLTVNKLVEIAEKAGIKVVFSYLFGWDKILKEHGETAVNETYRVMITNAPVTETRSKFHEAKHKRVVDQAGFDGLPTLMEYLVLIISTRKVSGKYLCEYRGKNHPLTHVHSSTHVRHFPLVVGYTPHLDSFSVDYGFQDEHESFCAGGRQKV